jgi:hypothetical protein
MPVCTVPKAPKDAGVAKPPAVAVPKCADGQALYAVDLHGKLFCASVDGCNGDKDCNGKGKCIDAMLMSDDGTPMLNHNNSPMGGPVCKPN